MAGDPLKDYIKKQLANGYSKQEILSFLVKNGYQPQLVEYKFRELGAKSGNASKALLVLAALILVSAVSFSAYYIPKLVSIQQTPELLLDLNVDPVRLEVSPGEELIFIKGVDSLGTKKRYDVRLVHNAIHIASGRGIATKTETLAVETRASTQTRLLLPKNAPEGNYLLKTRAFYDSNQAEASFLFVVRKEGGVAPAGNETTAPQPEKKERPVETCFDGVKNQNEEGVDCGGVCRPCEHRDKLSADDALSEVAKKAKENPEAALLLCERMPKKREKDECTTSVAAEAGVSAYCSRVSIVSLRDSCYMRFALQNDFSVCEKVSNSYLKNSCFTLASRRAT